MDTPPNNDHDLLITIKEKITNLGDEVRLLRDGNNERLKNVELNKLEKTDFNQFKLDLKDTLAEMQNDNNKAFLAQGIINKDFAGDIKILYRIVWTIIGVGIVIQLFAKELVSLLFSLHGGN